MLFYTLKIGNETYNCKISAKGLCNLESRLGCNPLNIFMSMSDNNLPKISDMLVVFHESLVQFNHGITMDQAGDIYDAYIDEGNSFVDFMNVILEILKVSGIIPKENTDEKATKKGKASAKN